MLMMDSTEEMKPTVYPIHKGPLFNCCFCGTMFISMNFLHKHSIKCIHRKIFSLLRSKLTIKSERLDLIDPLRARELPLQTDLIERNDDFYCNVCFRGFLNVTKFNKHMVSHSDIRPYKCNECEKSFKRKDHLSNHVQNAHKRDRNYTCYVCSKVYTRKQSLDYHLITHNTIKPHSCNICEARFTSRQSLLKHLRAHTGEKPFSCLICGSKFSHKQYLTQHLQTHTGKKSYPCPHCPNRYSAKRSLVTHLKLHIVTDDCQLADLKLEKF